MQDATAHSIVEKLLAAYEVAQWARNNGFDPIEIVWAYESTIETILQSRAKRQKAGIRG